MPPLPSPVAARKPPRLNLGLRLRELVAGYLPLLLMALLALATWWLVQNTPQAPAPAAERPLLHEPDYTMQQFTLQRFAREGTLRLQIEGDRLRHYPDTDTIEIDGVRIRAVGEDGGLTVATAQRALADAAGTDVQLLGGAQVVREAQDGQPAVEFRGEFLHLLVEAEKLRSHLPVELRQGRDVLRAGGIEYDHRSRSARLQGPIRARFEPPAARGR